MGMFKKIYQSKIWEKDEMLKTDRSYWRKINRTSGNEKYNHYN